MVPIRSLRAGSSIVGVGGGTIRLNKRLMSNATAFSTNNSKGKELKLVAARDCHQMVGAKVVSHHFAEFLFCWFNCCF